MEEFPDGSIYLWMYRQGLHGVEWQEVSDACRSHHVSIRQKDMDNYWNGWYRRRLYGRDILSFGGGYERPVKSYFDMDYEDYPEHPFKGMPDILNKWVPCNQEGRPLYRWSEGCKTLADARAMRGCRSLAENMKGQQYIVIDCDGDHDPNGLDYEAIRHFGKIIPKTHCLSKPKSVSEYGEVPEAYSDLAGLPASFHLTFRVDREIPTMHFKHVDIIGNKANSLRYIKNKEWNGEDPIEMDQDLWEYIQDFLRGREL